VFNIVDDDNRHNPFLRDHILAHRLLVLSDVDGGGGLIVTDKERRSDRFDGLSTTAGDGAREVRRKWKAGG
jgi:hypothetical protein